MSDGQTRTLAGYKSKVHEQGEFENPNEGKPPLNDSDEYVLRLTEFPHVKAFQQISVRIFDKDYSSLPEAKEK